MPLDISTPDIFIRCQHTHPIPDSDIWWSSLKICSNLFNWGPLTPKRAVPILLECFLVQLYLQLYFRNIKTTLGIYRFTPRKDTGHIHSKTLSWDHKFRGLLASFLKHFQWQKTLSAQSSSAIHHICHRCLWRVSGWWPMLTCFTRCLQCMGSVMVHNVSQPMVSQKVNPGIRCILLL